MIHNVQCLIPERRDGAVELWRVLGVGLAPTHAAAGAIARASVPTAYAEQGDRMLTSARYWPEGRGILQLQAQMAELASIQRLAIAAEAGEVDAHQAAGEIAARLGHVAHAIARPA